VETLTLNGRRVGPGEPPYVIAEVGANHNGDMALCRELIDVAHACGADAVKFQSWSQSSLISSQEYARARVYGGGQGTMTLEEAVARYQLTPDMHVEAAAHCRERGITFLSSCFAAEEVDRLDALGVPAFKIASMDVNHLPLLEHVASKGKAVVLSTGMATLGEIERALATLRGGGAGPVALLHCVSLYPPEPALVNLRNIGMLRDAFDVPVGYSDHTLGTAFPIASVALGACLIEKHFTLDHDMEGWDHAVSADPTELRDLVRHSRDVFIGLGQATRQISGDEVIKRRAFRRRLVMKRPMNQGERLSLADVEFKRPGTGICPDELAYVLGRTLTRSVAGDEEIEWTDLA
jgi:N-acetylneuraminate synthase